MVVRINMTLILVCLFVSSKYYSPIEFINLIQTEIADEFSSQDEDDEIGSRNSIQGTNRRSTSNPSTPKIISRCKAIYAYTPKLDDELEINPGK